MRLLPRTTVLVLVCLSFTARVSTRPDEVPTPKVTPLAAGTPGSADHNYPFFSTDIVLANFGYVEEEFMYEGTANTVNQISTHFRNKRYLSGIIAGTAQITDGTADDLGATFGVGPNTIITPVR